MKRTYAVVFERAPNNYAAYCPDVPGCVSTGEDWPEMLSMIREALEFHIETTLEYGEELPEPTMSVPEAMRYHADVIAEVVAECGDDLKAELPTEVTVAMVEVEINIPAPVSSKEAVSVGD